MNPKPVTLYRGDTWRRTWYLQDNAGAAIDLTGCTARLMVRDRDGLAVITAGSTTGEIVIDGAAGSLVMTVAAADTGLTPGRYRYDLEVTYTDGSVTTYEQNTLVVLEDVTHD